MSKTWKWIIGIVIVLVVVAAVAFATRGFFASRYMLTGDFNRFEGPMGRSYENFRHPMNGYRDFRHPRVALYNFMSWPFMFFGGFLRLLFPLLVLAGVGYFSYQKGKKDAMATAAGKTSRSADEDTPTEVLDPKG